MGHAGEGGGMRGVTLWVKEMEGREGGGAPVSHTGECWSVTIRVEGRRGELEWYSLRIKRHEDCAQGVAVGK